MFEAIQTEEVLYPVWLTREAISILKGVRNYFLLILRIDERLLYVMKCQVPGGRGQNLTNLFKNTLYKAFSDLGVISISFGPKMESMVNMSNSLISTIYKLGRSLQAKSMQISTYNADVVFSSI